MKTDIIYPVPRIQAERNLKTWLKRKRMRIVETREWCQWDYNKRPFWSVWAIVGGVDFIVKTMGIHIYDDGEILITSWLDWE